MKSPLSNASRSTTAWALALAATLTLLVAVVLPPVLPPGARVVLMSGFHALCHQLPERSFSIEGVPLAACHRCTGIYVGLVLGVLSTAVVSLPRPAGKRFEGLLLLVGVLPVALDWGGDVLGLWTNTVGTRVATGLWFGVFAGVLFADAISRRRQPHAAIGAA